MSTRFLLPGSVINILAATACDLSSNNYQYCGYANIIIIDDALDKYFLV